MEYEPRVSHSQGPAAQKRDSMMHQSVRKSREPKSASKSQVPPAHEPVQKPAQKPVRVCHSTLLKSSSKVMTPSGLIIKGETCYANAILQAVSVFPEFYTLCPERRGLLKAFRNILMLLSESKRSVVDPLVFLTHLQTQMRITNPGTAFRWDKQEDVPEVLEVLIAALNEASPPARTFSDIVVRSTVICTVCSYSSSVDSIQPILWMNIKQSLTEMIEDYETDDILEGETAYMCSQCNRKQRALRRSAIVRCPDMLIVAMRRFKRT